MPPDQPGGVVRRSSQQQGVRQVLPGPLPGEADGEAGAGAAGEGGVWRRVETDEGGAGGRQSGEGE